MGGVIDAWFIEAALLAGNFEREKWQGHAQEDQARGPFTLVLSLDGAVVDSAITSRVARALLPWLRPACPTHQRPWVRPAGQPAVREGAGAPPEGGGQRGGGVCAAPR